ncbi:DNA polymerase IV, partial [Pasteurella multocida]|nr:DNA polymerase IV [Pasteurella multocida]
QNKPNGQFVIKPEQIEHFIANLPLIKIAGVDKVKAQRLLARGINTCAHIQHINKARLLEQFGKLGQRIWSFSHCVV